MSKFDYSLAALDKGLTDEEVNDFEQEIADFQDAVTTTNLKKADADQLRVLYAQWLSVGRELYEVTMKVSAARALHETPPSIKEQVNPTLLSRLLGIFSRDRKGD